MASTDAERLMAELVGLSNGTRVLLVPDHSERHLTLLSEYSTDPPEPLLLDRLDPIGPTILYGPGGAGKGLLAVAWAARLQARGLRVAILDYEDHPEEWARRLHGLGGTDATSIVHHISPLRALAPGDRGGLAGHVDQLRLELDDAEVDYLVVDSAIMAAPGDTGSPEPVQAYFGALQRLGRPSLTLAHTNRVKDYTMPFGSSFWHNLARVTWSLVPDGNERSKLVNRKHNNYEYAGAYIVTSDWWNGLPREVTERSYGLTISERLADVLAAGAATVDDLTVALNDDDTGGGPVKRESIRRQLQRGLTSVPKRWSVVDDVWRLEAFDQQVGRETPGQL